MKSFLNVRRQRGISFLIKTYPSFGSTAIETARLFSGIDTTLAHFCCSRLHTCKLKFKRFSWLNTDTE